MEDLEIDQSNRIIDQKMNIGGSGIDVARIIKILQGEPMVLSFLGGLNGRYIKSNLDKAKIKSSFYWVGGDTMMNTYLIDSVNGTKTTLRDVGLKIGEKDSLRFKQEIKNFIKDSGALLINGNVNVEEQEVLQNFYLEMIEIAKSLNAKIVISTKGELLRKTLSFGPYGIHVKQDEIRELGIIADTKEEILKQLHEILVNHHIHYIAVDLGLEGAYLISRKKICYGEPHIKKEPIRQESRESAFLAAFTIGIERKYEQEKIVKLMVAASYATMVCEESQSICKKSDIDTLSKKIKILEVMNSKKGWML